MGLWDSVCSSVGDFFSGARDIVCSAAASLGPILTTATSTLLKVAGPYLNAISTIVQLVGILFDVISAKENPEELGAKAMQADKQPENFNSNAEYIDYLRNEVKLDQAKFDNPSAEDKDARTAVGVSIIAKGIQETKGFDIPIEAWVALARVGLDKESNLGEINTILDTFKGEKLESFSDYTKGSLDAKKELEVGNTLVDMYHNLEPDLSKEEIELRVMKMDRGDQ